MTTFTADNYLEVLQLEGCSLDNMHKTLRNINACTKKTRHVTEAILRLDGWIFQTGKLLQNAIYTLLHPEDMPPFAPVVQIGDGIYKLDATATDGPYKWAYALAGRYLKGRTIEPEWLEVIDKDALVKSLTKQGKIKYAQWLEKQLSVHYKETAG